ncbi:hypothetical protein D3870_17660 [Noviherbaspirillum cavernae]|uniref:DUF4410 domain-containing protein n=1 Tax=Noviherbaspirillum cavernae TaxID=2320862 RepID=A0A418X5A6_9BURK|nr:hypothetical protein D3870_17660 [Noviherbaspirillum cavernae]
MLLSGCATSQPEKDSAQTTGPAVPAASASTQKAVPVPAASSRKLVLNMSGAKTSVEARDWSGFKEEWRAVFEEHAKEAGIAFAMQEGEPRPLGEAGTLLAVHVNDYRMVGIGSRIFFGVMTGNAYVDARVRFTDLSTGKSFGEQDYNTSSSAWHGIFAKMTPQQVDAIATGVFHELKRAH